MRSDASRVLRGALCAALALTLSACGPRGQASPTHQRIIIRAEDGMPPTRVPGPVEADPAPEATIAATRAAYPEPELTSTPTSTPAAYP